MVNVAIKFSSDSVKEFGEMGYVGTLHSEYSQCSL